MKDVHEKLPDMDNSGVHAVAMRRTGGGMTADIRAPFPWFGGKSRVAPLVWERFGEPANYVEPFAGSLAVLLARPTEPRIETVNDLDCYLANFWRATAAAPEEVARHADWPVNEADLHARHRWLVGQAEFRERMRRDPEFFDARIAGWWVWGLCAWIGSGWCDTARAGAGSDVFQKIPEMGSDRGVHRLTMREPSEQLPMMAGTGPGQGIHGAGVRSALYDTFARLAARLRYVRVACGDWRRVLTDSVTWRHGTTAVFLDPPYGDDAERAGDLYAHDSGTVAADVRAWCVEHGPDARLRIALCGYAGEGHEALEGLGWTVEAWKAKGGYGGQRKDGENENAARERVWFSPGCLSARQRTIFDMLAEAPVIAAAKDLDARVSLHTDERAVVQSGEARSVTSADGPQPASGGPTR